MAQKKVCVKEFKIQAVKLGREIGFRTGDPDSGCSYKPYRGGAEVQTAKQRTGKRDFPFKRGK